MQLKNILNSVNYLQVNGNIEGKSVECLCYDSRQVVKNSIYVAVKGFNFDGHNYIADAVNKGASVIILDDINHFDKYVGKDNAQIFILVKDSRKALAELSTALYSYPSQQLSLIGVTGTNGKTTTTFILKSIFEAVGGKTGLIGTISNSIGDRKIETEMTTPESVEINSLLRNMADEDCSYCAMEVSSHSLSLSRVHKLKFAAAIFTNITPEHLDFHNTFDEYVSAKKILFDNLEEDSFCVYNIDDESAEIIVGDTVAQKISFGMNGNSTFRISDISYDMNGTAFKIIHLGHEYEIKSSMVGGFNAYNIAGAFATAYMLGIKPEDIVRGIANAPQVPGRFEVLNRNDKVVVIDYAHTADSLEKTLQNIRSIIGKCRQLFTVFGCGGDRDKTKRPIMGKIASELSDFVIVTNDNPRTENPTQIIKDIICGIENDNYKIMENRKSAIEFAVKSSGYNCVILVAGKGHEDYQIIGKEKLYCSDKEIAINCLNEIDLKIN